MHQLLDLLEAGGFVGTLSSMVNLLQLFRDGVAMCSSNPVGREVSNRGVLEYLSHDSKLQK